MLRAYISNCEWNNFAEASFFGELCGGARVQIVLMTHFPTSRNSQVSIVRAWNWLEEKASYKH